MNFRSYVWFMSLATLLAWGTWAFVILRIDPEETGMMGLFLFYLTLFAALIGTMAVFGVLYRVMILKRKDVVSREVKITFRHSILLSIVGIVSLALSAANRLNPWIVGALFLIVGVVEYGFLLVQESRRV